MLFCKGFDRNNKKRWIPIPRFHEDRFHGNDREEKTGSMNRTPAFINYFFTITWFIVKIKPYLECNCVIKIPLQSKLSLVFLLSLISKADFIHFKNFTIYSKVIFLKWIIELSWFIFSIGIDLCQMLKPDILFSLTFPPNFIVRRPRA